MCILYTHLKIAVNNSFLDENLIYLTISWLIYLEEMLVYLPIKLSGKRKKKQIN